MRSFVIVLVAVFSFVSIAQAAPSVICWLDASRSYLFQAVDIGSSLDDGGDVMLPEGSNLDVGHVTLLSKNDPAVTKYEISLPRGAKAIIYRQKKRKWGAADGEYYPSASTSSPQSLVCEYRNKSCSTEEARALVPPKRANPDKASNVTPDSEGVAAFTVILQSHFQDRCIGTLVARDMVLTAGHCTRGNAYLKWGSRVEFPLAHKTSRILGVASQEGVGKPYDEKSMIDIALIHFDGKDLPPGYQPVVVLPRFDAITMKSTGLLSVALTKGLERAGGNNPFETHSHGVSDLNANIGQPGNYIALNSGADNLCSGNSGGAGLLKTSQGRYYLWGMLTAATGEMCSQMLIYLSLERFTGWLERVSDELRSAR